MKALCRKSVEAHRVPRVFFAAITPRRGDAEGRASPLFLFPHFEREWNQ